MSETLSIVGAGRVGRALGRQLRELGWRIGVVTGRSITTARAAVHAIGAGHPMDRLTSQIFASEVVLIATPDSAIEGLAEKLGRLGGDELRGKVVLHTSGALDSSVLRPLADKGAATGSMHPMQTFSNQSTPKFERLVFGIDGSSVASNVARKMIHQMGGIAIRLSGPNKAAYHAAASFACSHVLALMETATQLLMSQGFTRRQAGRALLSLTRQMLDNFERVGPRAAWTGPLTRGDYSTVRAHAEALADFPHEYLEAYKALSRLTAAVLSTKPGPMLQQLDGVFAPASNAQKKSTQSGKNRLRKDKPQRAPQ
jgi:predicted short-subunit dehydrogenase-like oxidoreductase (DUF2520 family)